MKDQLHCMLDIETMDNGPSAAVVAIGARLFTLTGPTKGFEIFIDPNVAMHLGTVGNDTMDWWRKQPAYEQVFSGRFDPADAVHRFNEFIAKHKPSTVWANSPSFDCTILRFLEKQVSLKWPFHYRDERDCRTLFALGRALEIPCEDLWANPDRRGHMPLDDATTQAEVTARILAQVFSSPAAPVGLDFGLPQAAPEPPAPEPAATAADSPG